MKLVIVESPAKSKKIAGFLGHGWRVEAFHSALARVQKAGSEQGLYGAAHVAAGRLWLVRVDRDGIDERPIADLGA